MRHPWAQWRCHGDNDVLHLDYLCGIDDAHSPPSVVVVGAVVALSLFLLFLSSLSSSPIGVIVAAVATIVAIVLVAPAAVALAAPVVTLTVVATTFLAVDVALVVDCCVPSPQEEDHHLPPPLGKVPSWPLSP